MVLAIDDRHGWWMTNTNGERCNAHLATVLAELYPVAIGCLATNARLNSGDVYEVASRIIQRLITEYQRGKTYSVHPLIVVRQYCKFLTKEYFAEQAYSRHESLDATTRRGKDEGHETPRQEAIDPGQPLADAVVHSILATNLLGDPSIPAGERDVLELRYRNDLDIEEIASCLGIQRNAVDQRLHRGLRRLRGLSLGA